MQSSPVRADTDAELVKRFQSGADREGALVAIFERYGKLTYAFLRRRIGNPEVAAELNQELFISVLESLDRFRGESSFKTWLFRLAHHRVANLRRRWRVHLDELPGTPPEELLGDLVASDEQQPDQRFAHEESARHLRRCLAGLSEVERVVVIGQYYEGVTLGELTRRLRLTNKSGARASLIAAQRKLRRCLERAGFKADP